MEGRKVEKSNVHDLIRGHCRCKASYRKHSNHHYKPSENVLSFDGCCLMNVVGGIINRHLATPLKPDPAIVERYGRNNRRRFRNFIKKMNSALY